jgi:hypothetical protein
VGIGRSIELPLCDLHCAVCYNVDGASLILAVKSETQHIGYARRNPQSLLPCSVLSEHAAPCKINNQRIVFIQQIRRNSGAQSVVSAHWRFGRFRKPPKGLAIKPQMSVITTQQGRRITSYVFTLTKNIL